MAPADRRTQRLVPVEGAPAAAGQQPEAVVEPLQNLLGGQRPQPPGRQLQGQRNPVQPAAQLAGRAPAAVGQPEVRAHPGGPLGEQPQRVLVGHRGERMDALARQLQRQPARREHPQPGGAPQQLPYQRGALVHQMFETVQDQQEAAAGAVLDERRAGRPGGLVGQPQRPGHGVFQQPGIAHGGQLHQPDTVAVPFLQKCGGAGDQPGLADAAHPGDRHQPGLLQRPRQRGQLALAAHEAVQLGGEIARTRVRGGVVAGGRGTGITGGRRGALRASHETRRVLA